MKKGDVQGIPQTQVIIAALNEEEGISLTIGELIYDLRIPHVLVVDGGSTDRTVEVAKNLGARSLCRMEWAKATRWQKPSDTQT
jgi:glycosyltransferase involved in cell wall biosynthesis